MPDSIGLEFPIDGSGQWEGFNSSGMEHFAGKPFIALGREVLQNSLDAARDAETPVKVKIDAFDIPLKDLPNLSDYKRAFELSELSLGPESEKAAAFFVTTRDLFQQSKIKVLRIADYNTTGLVGPCVNGTPYFALMKAQGVSVKHGEDSLGSYGIGKFAPFAVSALRTIFVSTVWKDADIYRHYAQGKTVVGSHRDTDGLTHRGTGFWGNTDQCMPVEGFDAIPNWLQRCSEAEDAPHHVGTTLFVLGFRPVKNWQAALAGAIIENFFGAIDSGRMEVDIGQISITKQTLQTIFSDELVRKATLELTDEPDDFENSRFFLEALSSDGVFVEQHENQHLGLCELRLIVKEGLPRRVAILRDGMLITDNLPRLRRFGDFKEFVAVVECKAAKGNKLLRAMEPPAHDAFEPDRLPEEQRKAGKVALNDLAKWVRDAIAKRARHLPSEVTNIDELKDFFADALEGAAGAGEREEDPAGRVKIQARPSKKPKKTPGPGEADGDSDSDSEEGNDDASPATGGGADGGGGGDGGDEGGDHGTSGPQGPGTTDGVGGESGGQRKRMPTPVHGNLGLANVRAVPLGPDRRRVSFTPTKTCKARLMVQDSGADTNHKLQITQASVGFVSQGVIEDVELTAGVRCVVEITVNEDFPGTMRVIADAI